MNSEKYLNYSGQSQGRLMSAIATILRQAVSFGSVSFSDWLNAEETDLCGDPSGPFNWMCVQGEYLGLFAVFYYLIDAQHISASMLEDAEDDTRISLPVLECRNGIWSDESATEQGNDVLAELRKHRKTRAEFYSILAENYEWRRSDIEKRLNILFCSEGEVSAFLFEWRLRQLWEARRESAGAPPDIVSWVSDNLQTDGELMTFCRSIGLVHSDGRLRYRGERLCEFVLMTTEREQMGSENRFALEKNGDRWSDMFVAKGSPDDFISTLRDVDDLSTLPRIAHAMLSGRRDESSTTLAQRARFLLESHLALRRDDSGLPKPVFALQLLKPATRDGIELPLGFVVGALHIPDPPSESEWEETLKTRFDVVRPLLAAVAQNAISYIFGSHQFGKGRMEGQQVGILAGGHALLTELDPLLHKTSVYEREHDLKGYPKWVALRQSIRWLGETALSAVVLGKDQRACLTEKDFAPGRNGEPPKALRDCTLLPLIEAAWARVGLEHEQIGCVIECNSTLSLDYHKDYLRILFQEMFRNSADSIRLRRLVSRSGVYEDICVEVLNEGDNVKIKVSDNGMGNAERLPLGIVKPKPIDQRLSVGLSMIVRVLELHQAPPPNVIVSDPDRGTTIEFSLSRKQTNLQRG